MKREELRKVVFKESEYDKGEIGYFHQWSTNSYTTMDTVGHFPVGIIENEKGEVLLIHGESIKFL